MSCLGARLRWREKQLIPSLSLTITKPQVQNSQLNDVTTVEKALNSINQ